MRKPSFNISSRAIISFMLTFALCSMLSVYAIVNRSRVEKLTMEQLILEKSAMLNDVISKLLYKTQALSALVIQNNGEVSNFEDIASAIIDDPSILNILLAPGGVITHVYPLEGNEVIIGFDYFSDNEGNKEALMAKETGELVFGGPFNVLQGGQALVGRLPVYINDPEKGKTFWGLVSVTLKYPEVLDGVRLSMLEKQGFAYEIWRINPDNNEKQVIISNALYKAKNTSFVERHIPILNADWYFRIFPIKNWYEYAETWLLVCITLIASVLIARLTQNNCDLEHVKLDLETMVRLDTLTEIWNRRFFMEIAAMQIEKSSRAGGVCYIIMFDLDHFKDVNDLYGHIAGDQVLKAVARSVKDTLRSYDLLARYGGEEFIMLIADIDKATAKSLVDRVRRRINETTVVHDSQIISVSASFGISMVEYSKGLDAAVKNADTALYKAKSEGRNKVVYFDVGMSEFE